VRVVHVGDHPLDALPVLRHLKQDGLVAIQLDRAVSRAGLEVALCGRPFTVPAGPFHLARLSGAPIVPIFTRRLGYFRYEIEISPPIRVSADSGPEGLRGAALTAADRMGQFLRKNPTQWFHFARQEAASGTENHLEESVASGNR